MPPTEPVEAGEDVYGRPVRPVPRLVRRPRSHSDASTSPTQLDAYRAASELAQTAGEVLSYRLYVSRATAR